MPELNEERMEILEAWAKDLLTTYQGGDFEIEEMKFIEEILEYAKRKQEAL